MVEHDSDVEEQNEDATKETKKTPPKQAFFMLMESRDKMFWRISVLCSIIGGARFPLMALYMGDSFNTLGAREGGKSMSEQIEPTILRMIYISIASGFFKGSSDVCMAVVQHSMVAKYQQRFLETLLRKDSSWYDLHGPSVLLSAMTTAVFQVSDLFGPELPSCIMGISAFLLSTGIAIGRSWQLGLIFVGVLPLMILGTAMGFRGFMKYNKISSGILGGGTMCLEQGLWGIRTVAAYGLELTIGQNLEPWVRMSRKAGIPYALRGAAGFACRMFVEWGGAALMYYVGSRFVIAADTNVMTGNTWTPGDIFSVWFIQYLGMAQLQMSLGYAQTFGEGKGAFATLAKYSEGGEAIEGADQDRAEDGSACTLDDIESIEFDNVSFRYPSRPEALVLDQVSFTVKKGARVALVGESGSGKSTIIGLIERFYEPEAGHIKVNGRDIRDYPLASLRRAVALVEQEPVLFASSLRRNLEYARSGPGQMALTDTEINEITSKCAMDFVDTLPQKVDTYVGAKGRAFSGGQKQRCCIARALLRRPHLLLLDEATAALDNRSEKEIQATLDEVMTTAGMSIAIAHRLSTIKQCDMIMVFSKGRIVERGSHDELMQIGVNGMYYGLVKLQEVAADKEQDKRSDEGNQNVGAKAILTVTDDTTDTKVLDLSKITPRRFWHVMPALWREIFRFSPANGILCIIVQLGQMGMSATHPIFALVLISMMTSLYGTDKEEMDKASLESAFLLVLLGVAQAVCIFIRIGGGICSSENFMCMARIHMARNLIFQDISYFDNPDCTPAKILILFSSLLREGYLLIRMVSAQLVDAMGTFIVTLTIAFSREPKVAGVVLAVWPVNMITKYMEFRDLLRKFRRGSGGDSESASAQVFHDCISFLRTVRAMQAERAMQRDFTELVQQEGFKNFRAMILTALIRGLAYTLEMMLFAFTFWWAACVIDDGGNFDRCMQAGMVIILGLMPMSSFLSAFDRFGERVEAGARTLDFLHHPQSIHRPEDTKGKLLPMLEKPPTIAPYNVHGKKIVFENVEFVYQQRPEVMVLKSVILEVNLGEGQLVGFCGPSGGGKSSLLALLMRFYDPSAGVVRVDGLGNLRELDVKRWRRTISYVSQEPTLFQDTLLNNVRYGCPEAGPEEVSRAATMAHIDFTCDSPHFNPSERMERPRFMLKGDLQTLGFTEESFAKFSETINQGAGLKKKYSPSQKPQENDVSVFKNNTNSTHNSGDAVRWIDTVRESSLSGGQKQRVAIARAFLRNSPILIFDEGTSALDSYSEKKVQESLKELRKHQTQFLIAHRLSTIADANLVVVVSMGVIAESGTSQELLDKRGIYYNLVQGSK